MNIHVAPHRESPRAEVDAPLPSEIRDDRESKAATARAAPRGLGRPEPRARVINRDADVAVVPPELQPDRLARGEPRMPQRIRHELGDHEREFVQGGFPER